MRSTQPAIALKKDDDVAVLSADVASGDTVETAGRLIEALQPIPKGHKIAIRPVAIGQSVRKYGQPIGAASVAIAVGDHVHTHNLAVKKSGARGLPTLEPVVPAQRLSRVFNGYRRAAGLVGTRNYVAILTTVNCSASVARKIADNFPDRLYTDDPHFDGVVALTHAGGCGTPHEGEGVAMLERTIGGFARHPNFGAVLIVGLGCEVNQIERLCAREGLEPGPRLRTLGIQDIGGAKAAIDEGRRIVAALVEIARADRRTQESAAHLMLALQCGGSDAWSGVSANPALGAASDILINAGGASILGETPELYGAEDLLLRRATTPGVAQQLSDRLRWWEDYAAKNNADLNNNPSPGNLKGGLTTIFEKSLGAVAKAGSAPLTGFYQYAERIEKPGLAFMDSPGYDPCSVTGEIASGANLVAFTTGRGSVFGSKPAPCIKLSSNSELARRQADDIDIDCGRILAGEASVADLGAEIFEMALRVASGERTKSEEAGMGDLEFIPWYVGAAM